MTGSQKVLRVFGILELLLAVVGAIMAMKSGGVAERGGVRDRSRPASHCRCGRIEDHGRMVLRSDQSGPERARSGARDRRQQGHARDRQHGHRRGAESHRVHRGKQRQAAGKKVNPSTKTASSRKTACRLCLPFAEIIIHF